MKHLPVHALSHITGGGLLENLPRVLPENTSAVIDTNSWDIPPVFQWLQEAGNVDQTEMYRTLNCGVGMVICVAADKQQQALELLKEAGEDAWVIGQIEASTSEEAVILK